MAAEEDFDFDFDIEDTSDTSDGEDATTNLNDVDRNFLDSIHAKTTDNDSDKANDAFNFWFLVLLMILFMFLLTLMAIFIVRGRRIRSSYEDIGYQRSNRRYRRI